MKEALPAPSFVPTTVTIIVPAKGVTLKGIRVKSTDSANDLKVVLEKKLKDAGHPVVSLPESHTFTLRRPFDLKRGKAEEASLLDSEEVPITDELIPLFQYNLTQGSELIVTGKIQFVRYVFWC